MKILVIGSGGREHALAWRLAQGSKVQKVFVAPGNAGTALEDGVENVALSTIPDLIDFVKKEDIYMTVVGPEVPLAAGVVDDFRAAGLKIFGPTKAAARLESSKDFAKAFMVRHNIPTAFYQTFSDASAARAYVQKHGAPIVIKADGLAAGKGVVVAMSVDEAFAAIDSMLSDNKLGDAGARVVVEEFLAGEEASFIVMVDGKNVLAMATSQDHKRLQDGDQGPNTGGMGAYSPAPVVTPDIHRRVMAEVINPTLQGMREDGYEYTGFLYAGLMIDKRGAIKVLEYNCRFGDPETQPIMLRLQSDLVELCLAALDKTLDKAETAWDPRPALGVVLAAGGYPDDYAKGHVISGLPAVETADTKVFHAGTRQSNGNVLTNGGRVLCACALGENIADAQAKAYELCGQIDWQDVYYRTDIGFKALGR